MKSIYFCVSLIVISQLIEAVPGRPCPNGWAYDRAHRGRKCYRYLNATVNIAAARQLCSDFNASLVSIQSPEEQSFLVDYVFRKNQEKAGVWLGARKVAGTLVSLPLPSFVWDDEAHFLHTNWEKGAPRLDPNDSCVIMQFEPLSITALGSWREQPCNDSFGVVCQVKAVRVATSTPSFLKISNKSTIPNPFRKSLERMSSEATPGAKTQPGATPGAKNQQISGTNSDFEDTLRDHAKQLHSLHEAIDELHNDISLVMVLFCLVLIFFLVSLAMVARRRCRRERRRRGVKALGMSEARNGGKKLLAAEPEGKKETCFVE